MTTISIHDYRLDQQAQGPPIDPAILRECVKESAERARPIIIALTKTKPAKETTK